MHMMQHCVCTVVRAVRAVEYYCTVRYGGGAPKKPNCVTSAVSHMHGTAGGVLHRLTSRSPPTIYLLSQHMTLVHTDGTERTPRRDSTVLRLSRAPRNLNSCRHVSERTINATFPNFDAGVNTIILGYLKPTC